MKHLWYKSREKVMKSVCFENHRKHGRALRAVMPGEFSRDLREALFSRGAGVCNQGGEVLRSRFCCIRVAKAFGSVVG